jgi:MATE family multidrug resistance protein
VAQTATEPLLPPAGTDPRRWAGLGEVLYLAVPSIVNMTSLTVMHFVDARMVADLGKGVLGAQMIGGSASFVTATFFMGVLSCVNTFAAQNLGAGRPERAALYGWQGVWTALLAWAVLAPLIPLAPLIFRVFGHAPEVRTLETRYFQVLISGVGLMLTARALGQFFVGIHQPVVPLLSGLVGNAVNVLMNYLLIYGKFGFPALGLVGAGLGTVIGGATEAILVLGLFAFGPTARRFQVRASCRFSLQALGDLFRIGAPAGMMFLSDVLMWVVFMGVVVGQFGPAHLDAAAILNQYLRICFMPALGVGAAATALVGRYCGSRRPDLAWRRAHVAFGVVEAYMVGVGAVMWLNRGPLVAFFNQTGDPHVQQIATAVFIFILIVQVFDAMNVAFIGSLRGAGDTLVPSLIQVVLAWGMGLGGGLLVTRWWPEWGSLGAWGVATAYISVLGLAMWGRFLSGRWRRPFTGPPMPVAVEEAAQLPPG